MIKLAKLVESLLFISVFCSLLGCTSALIEYLDALGNPRTAALAGLRYITRGHKAPHQNTVAPQAIFDGTRIKNTFLGLIDKAQPKDTISLTVFIMTDRDIAQALIKKHTQGVTISIIADNGHAHKEYSQVPELIKAGINVYLHNPESPDIMHNKFWIFEYLNEQVVITGSYNPTHSAATKNAENIVVISHSETCKEYKDQHAKLIKNSILASTPKSKKLLQKIDVQQLDKLLKISEQPV